ncbi:MAG TPA: M3 family metallopeptidase [Bryobacteraceae bacterium]|nr:M3 family metallopeptidase [Bryobacteraceae bacterium]
MRATARLAVSVVLSCFACVLAQEIPASQPPIGGTKPDAEAFEKLENQRLLAAQQFIDKIAAVRGTHTVENTLALYDSALRELNTASYLSTLMQQVHPDSSFRDRATALTTKISGAVSELSLNRTVYEALAAIDVSHADAATRYYVQRQLLELRLAGVNKDDATRARLKKLNEELSVEQSMFDRNISDSRNTVRAVRAELEGLPQDYIDRHKPASDGSFELTTDYPDAVPVLNFARNDSLRRRMWVAFYTRAYPKNLEMLHNMMKTRYEIATLLGYPSWADYNAADKMVAKGENIASFIGQLETAAAPGQQRELQMLLAEKRRTNPQAKEIGDYEVKYLSEQVRRAQYDFDSQSVRPYFPYARVKQGILDTAATLFHLRFRQEPNSPAWDPAVETWDVIDGEKAIGRFYLDMHPRRGKFSHAEMSPVLDGIRGRQLPEAVLVCNFPAPTASDPGLMEYTDVVTFFHEFGHLVHWILAGQQQWAGISGISMETDFVEAPSQMLEEWMHSPQVLASFARDYKTGETIPADLVARMNQASAFGRAGWVSQQLVYSAISYHVHKGKPDDINPDVIGDVAQRRYTHTIPLPGTHTFAAFGHLAGYSSAYYTYLWDKVIAEDLFAQFDQKNLLAGEAPLRYRRVVLEPGGSMSANDLVKQFLGRPQNTIAFQRWMNEEFEAPAGKPHTGR